MDAPTAGEGLQPACAGTTKRGVSDMNEGDRDYQRLADVFKALGHPTRLQILAKTVSGEFCVQDLGDELDRRQPHISQHLTILRQRGLVVSQRKGKNVCYRPADSRIAKVIELTAEVLDRTGTS
jgi:ArsR family transcriptional regulator